MPEGQRKRKVQAKKKDSWRRFRELNLNKLWEAWLVGRKKVTDENPQKG